MSDTTQLTLSPDDDNIADLIWLSAAGMRRVETAVAHLVAQTSGATVTLLHSAHVQENGTLLVIAAGGGHEVTVHLERAQWEWSRKPS